MVVAWGLARNDKCPLFVSQHLPPPLPRAAILSAFSRITLPWFAWRLVFAVLITVATAGAASEVTWSATADTVTVSNGRVTATLGKEAACVTSLRFDGVEMVDRRGHIYYSMDGGESYARPAKCTFSVAAATPEMVDLRFRQTADPSSDQRFDMELHFVLRRGDTGLYSYAVLDHPATYPETSVGEFRLVWKLPNDGRSYRFERTYLDEARKGDWGSYADFAAAEKTEIPEVSKLVTGARAGSYDCKYQFAARYSEISCWGHASDLEGKGAWIVLGGQEYFNDGPTKQELTLAENYNLVHLNRNHFGGSEIRVAGGQAWRKTFGPFLLYCNATTAGAGAGDRLWADAKERAKAEQAAWPFAWVKHPDYPAANARGTVSGRLTIRDPLKPQVNSAGAWVGLAAAEATAGNWQDQALGYQFWTRADNEGRFRIPHVRSGTYTLYAFNDGAVGEFSRDGVKVSARSTTALSDLTWEVPHRGESIAWEIGTPDRTAREFLHGGEFAEPFIWKSFAAKLPNPLVYTIGQSQPATDWNYAHSGYLDAGEWTRWKWQIRFTLDTLPVEGNATLTLALASAHDARLQIIMNEEENPIARLDLTERAGNALIRQGMHAKYNLHCIEIPVARLRTGANTITLVQSRADGPSGHVMYDYLNLELPAPKVGNTPPRVTSIQKPGAPEATPAPVPTDPESSFPARVER